MLQDPTARISPQAEIGHDVEIGPLCVIGPGARIGAGSKLQSHVVIKAGAVLGANNMLHDGAIIKSGTTIGDDNEIHETAVVGGEPPVAVKRPRWGRLEIGSGNIIRELVTIQVATDEDAVTRIGDNNFIMPSVQIGHDARLGDHVTITTHSCVAGHAVLEDRATLGMGVLVHQHSRIGAYAMVGAGAYVSRDVPPFVMIDGRSGCVVGLNLVGIKRNGFTRVQIAELKQAYRIIYRRGLPMKEVLATLDHELESEPCHHLRDFLANPNSRGLTRERRKSDSTSAVEEANTEAMADDAPSRLTVMQTCRAA